MGREEERFQRRLSPSPWGTRQSGGGDIALPWNPLVLMGEAGRDKVPDPSSFCCCSVNKLNLTLCDPTDCSTPASLSFTISRSWLKLMSIESVMPSSHLVLCRPLLLLPSTFPCKTMHKNMQGNPTDNKTMGTGEPPDGGRVGWQRKESQVGRTGDAEPQRQSGARCCSGRQANLEAEWRDAALGCLSQKDS